MTDWRKILTLHEQTIRYKDGTITGGPVYATLPKDTDLDKIITFATKSFDTYRPFYLMGFPQTSKIPKPAGGHEFFAHINAVDVQDGGFFDIDVIGEDCLCRIYLRKSRSYHTRNATAVLKFIKRLARYFNHTVEISNAQGLFMFDEKG